MFQRICSVLLLAAAMCAPAFAQDFLQQTFVLNGANPSFSTTTSKGGNNLRAGFSILGSPTTVQVIVQGCMNPQNDMLSYGTPLVQPAPICDNIEIWNSTTNGSIPIVGLYDSFNFTATFTGGTNPSVNVDVTSTINETWSANTFYSPAQLNMNAIVEPATPTPTANSAIVSMHNVRALTAYYSCTQPAAMKVNLFAEDFTTNLGNLGITTAVTAFSGWYQTANTRTVFNDTAGANSVPIPAAAVSFFFVGSGATPGTCTLRLIKQY